MKKETKKLKVLIIDDDLELLEMYRYTFEKDGFEVKTETNGLLGITMAVQYQPDIILLDIMMPQMDGFETIRAFQYNTDMKTTILVLSNLNQPEKIEHALQSGADAFLLKANCTPRQVLEKALELLEQKKKENN